MKNLQKHTARWCVSMLEKLTEHADKGDTWEDDAPDDLLARVHEEIEELAEAIQQLQSPEDVRREASDVANMAMMVADAYDCSFHDLRVANAAEDRAEEQREMRQYQRLHAKYGGAKR